MSHDFQPGDSGPLRAAIDRVLKAQHELIDVCDGEISRHGRSGPLYSAATALRADVRADVIDLSRYSVWLRAGAPAAIEPSIPAFNDAPAGA